MLSRMRAGRLAQSIALLAILTTGSLAIAGTQRIAHSEFFAVPLSSGRAAGLIDNFALVPPEHATPPIESFRGTLRLAESEMNTTPVKLASRQVLGLDPKLFPAVRLTFFTMGQDLVPLTQEVIRAGSSGAGKSFWDIIVQPGRVWSEPGDAGWSRAAFPFALVNSREGETHNGIAAFLYKHGHVSRLRFQIVQQTAPFYVTDYFSASGSVAAKFEQSHTDFTAARTRFAASLADALPMGSFAALASRVPEEVLLQADSGVAAADLVTSAWDSGGTLYVGQCKSAAGPLPWCERARFGVWSATKSLANETALLRLAQKYGPQVLEMKIVDFIPEARTHPGWSEVRFEDAANMATGMGSSGSGDPGRDIFEGGLDHYAAWYEAKSEQEKIQAVLATARPYPWGPGKAARYRDQDMFMLGVAMDRFLKSREGAEASIWSLLEREVFEPIGIHYAPVNRTIEAGTKPGQPLMAFGFFATLDDLAKIARLYQNHGAAGGRQLLYAQRVAELLPGAAQRGLRTGLESHSGELRYFNAFWRAPVDLATGCRVDYPRMQGWGGTFVALFPGGVTAIRIAKTWEADVSTPTDLGAMERVADRLSPLCPPPDLDAFDAMKKRVPLAGGTTLAYVETGDPAGKSLVLVHGYTDSARDWFPLLPYLPQDRRIILIDLRGHGASDKPECCYTRLDFARDLKDVLDALHIDRADIVGHSLGSLITQVFAERWPERTRSVVLISSTAGVSSAATTAASASDPARMEYRSKIRRLRDPIDPESPFMREWYSSPTPVSSEFLRRQRMDAAAIPVRVWLAVLDNGIGDMNMAATLPQLKARALLIWGAQDPIFGAADRASLTAGLPGAAVKIFAELGHNPFWEDPQAVAAEINNFLAGD